MRRLSKAEFSILLLLLTLASSVVALVSQAQRARTDVIERAFFSAEDLVSLVVTANRHYIDSISGIPVNELTPEPDIETEKAWLPATFATRYTQSYSDQNPGADFRIYSRDPFSFQKDRVLDRFAEDALDVLLAGEIRNYREVEDVGDGFVRVRLARAFEMDANCISCHNRPQWGLQNQNWDVGDVRGAWEASILVPPTVLHARAEITALFALMAIALGLGAFAVFPAVRREVKDREFFHDRSVSMEKSADAYRQTALQDPLTKIGNRRAYDLDLAEIVRVHGETGDEAALILLDIDHFKRVNDTYGHDVGDDVIQTVATVLKNELRGADKVARIGGEEFSILTTKADHASVHSLATRIKDLVAAHVFNTPTGNFSVTISAGASFLRENGTDVELYKSADEFLYRAKSTGRNKVCIAD
jgi:diguanylate cyclase (GGDEF)-like protein